jgi:hypothetical protein
VILKASNDSYVELLVDAAGLSLVRSHLAVDGTLAIEGPVHSRDAAMAVAVISLAGNVLVLINELIKLRGALKERSAGFSVVIRSVDGKEVQLKDVTREQLAALLTT